MKPLLILSAVLYAAGFITVVFYHILKKSGLSAFSAWCLYAGVASHAAAVVLRTYLSGHLPIASVDETLLFYSCVTAALSAIVVLRYGERFTELVTMPVAIFTMFVSLFIMSEPRKLPLILRTYWFEVHVLTSFAAYSLFTLAFSGAVLYLIFAGGMGGAVENPGDFQDIAGRGMLWGFLFFSASMFAGAVWAYLAWGMYWMWEPKILWSFIVWFWYAGAIHFFYVRQWKAKGLSAAAIIGFVIVAFTYLGVGLLMKSSHSF
ncbi:MAG: cytochrome c biogenesis protein CcsA [Deltaproteobacteria bacterium]|nr:cytochrome c biogenesis protein CcsA [Deltaproteobacteria bacterium]